MEAGVTALAYAETAAGARWALRSADGVRALDQPLCALLGAGRDELRAAVERADAATVEATGFRTPLDRQEVWAGGVTYERSRAARIGETTVPDVYERVYDATRPELFLKSGPNRLPIRGAPLRVRRDSKATVPEPELALVCDSHGDIVGALVADDLTARDIEGENPLYLPQAKIFSSCLALSDAIVLIEDPDELADLRVECRVERDGETVFFGQSSTARIKRPLRELVDYLFRELDHPHGVVLLTGTGIVPPDSFSLRPGDTVRIAIERVGTVEHGMYRLEEETCARS